MRFIAVLGAVVMCAAVAAFAATRNTDSARDDYQAEVQESERQISLDDVPEAAREVILREAGDHAIREVEEVTAADGVTYQAEWIDGTNEVEIRVAPDGRILGREVEPVEEEPGDTEDGEGD